MFSTLSVDVQEDLSSLVERFGRPRVRFAQIDTARLFDPLSSTDRYGEVCMVIRRSNGHFITAKKTFYPTNAYRLLTGGIRPGEPVLDALFREIREETGLEVAVRRFLVAVAYHHPGQQDRPVFYTFAFLLDELGGSLECTDEDERLDYFREIAPGELLERAEFLDHIERGYSADLGGDWADWGQFRAVIHRLVWEALQ